MLLSVPHSNCLNKFKKSGITIEKGDDIASRFTDQSRFKWFLGIGAFWKMS